MTPTRVPDLVTGDVPDLLVRGMPMILRVNFPDSDDMECTRGVIHEVTVDEVGDVDTVGYYEDPRIGRGRSRPWSSTANTTATGRSG